MKTRWYAVIMAAVAVTFMLATPGTYRFLFTQAWPLIRESMLAWDGNEETIVTRNGTTVILQYEEDDPGADRVRAALDRAAEAAALWGPVPFPITVRVERDSLALKLIPSDLVMQPVGRAFDDFVVVLSPEADIVSEDGTRRRARNDIADILAHEFAHVATQHYTGNYGGGIEAAPTWFVEGAARFASGQAHWSDDIAISRHATSDLSRLVNDWYLFYTVDPPGAYEASGTLFTRLHSLGRGTLTTFMGRLRDGQTFDAAFMATYGLTVEEFVDDWWRDVERVEYFDDLDPYDRHATRERAEETCTEADARGWKCNYAFERLYACPRDLPGVCLTDYEFRMFSVINVIGGTDADRIGFEPWTLDCHCIDDGPWLSDFAHESDDTDSDD